MKTKLLTTFLLVFLFNRNCRAQDLVIREIDSFMGEIFMYIDEIDIDDNGVVDYGFAGGMEAWLNVGVYSFHFFVCMNGEMGMTEQSSGEFSFRNCGDSITAQNQYFQFGSGYSSHRFRINERFNYLSGGSTDPNPATWNLDAKFLPVRFLIGSEYHLGAIQMSHNGNGYFFHRYIYNPVPEQGFYIPCEILGSDQPEKDQQSLLFPNPTAGELSLDKNVQSLEIFDLSGKQVFASENPGTKLDLSSLQNGSYLVKHLDNEGTERIEKLIVFK